MVKQNITQLPKLPYTIENITGERLTFLRRVIKSGVEYLEVENEVQPNAGPPMHVHHRQDESVTIVSGKIGYQRLGEKKQYAGAGETVHFKAGEAHKFWNAGDDLLVGRGYISPADNIIYFLSEIYKSSNENGGRPGLYDSAFLLNRYKSEFSMLEIPAFVQKILFPIALVFGNMMGKHKKFMNAPAPL
jgi:quercetin dioxygenase-like cupin family protein